ncbi:MAG TPA: NADH-quinone oxidoreductase subunit NuoG [Armatimonadota bacterium]
MATIVVDGQSFHVEDGQNLLQACIALGLNLPYFCWHPALGSVGACRQCAVKQYKDEKDTRGRLVMACMTAAADGTRLSIEDAEAHEFRASVIEWMMINHPHDCPVCDEGGECHLQDMTVMTGHDYRRTQCHKRTFYNQNLGPLVNHEMNRCIQCYRCVRFYRDYAGGRDFDAFVLRNQVYFGRQADGVLESPFSGNLVEVCPTGVFTDKTLKRHYTRKWDLQTAPSVCAHCGVGCNTIPGERYGMLRRIRNRYNGEVNGYFLCDRGRYGYEFVNSERRIRQALLRREPGGRQEPVSKEEAIQAVAALLSGGARVIGIGSPRASLEANFALRALVGPDSYHAGLSGAEWRLLSSMAALLRNSPARSASLADVGEADAVLVLGEDVSNTAPMLALALRQSVRRQPMEIARKMRIPEWDDNAVREALQQERGPLYLATVCATRLDEIATRAYRAAPDDLARLGFAVAHALDPDAPPAPGLSDDLTALASGIATALKDAKQPLIVSGSGCGSEAVLRAAAAVGAALCAAGNPARLCFAVPECNSMGLALMGGEGLEAAVAAARKGAIDAVIVLENDLYRRAEAEQVNALFDAARIVIALDHLETPTVERADIVLPSATFAEGDGDLVNNEGRAQRFYQVFVPEGDTQESWRWLSDVAAAPGRPDGGWENLDGVAAAMAQSLDVFAPVLEVAPPAGFRIAGQKVAREPARYSGRTAISANIDVHEPQPPDDPDAPLSFSMEGFQEQPPSPLIPRFWAPGWNSIQALNKYQEEIAGPLRGGDPGRRLIEPNGTAKPDYPADIPAAFAPRADERLAVPLYHIFGSEELSALSPGVAELAPKPYVGISEADATALAAEEGDQIGVIVDGVTRYLHVRIVAGLPAGVVGLPVGLLDLDVLELPTWARLSSPGAG